LEGGTGLVLRPRVPTLSPAAPAALLLLLLLLVLVLLPAALSEASGPGPLPAAEDPAVAAGAVALGRRPRATRCVPA
jgi:hypothetical protein